MSTILEDDEYDYYSPLTTSVADTKPSSLAALTQGASVPFNSESHGGPAYGSKGSVAFDVNVCVSANDLKAAFKSADSIPISAANGFITNFQVLSGDPDLATNPDIPKLPTGLKIDQVQLAGLKRAATLECCSCPLSEKEKYKPAVTGASGSAASTQTNLTLPIREGSTIDRASILSIPVTGYAQTFGHSIGPSIRKTYIASPLNPLDVIINVKNPQPYINDYNSHPDVLSGLLGAISEDDINHARARNNGEVSRKGAFQVIDTLASNAEDTGKKYIPLATEKDLSKSEFRVHLDALPLFNPALGKVVPQKLTFDTLHLGQREGAKIPKEAIEKGNNIPIQFSFRIVKDFVAFPQPNA